ncbi:hypothetical protein C2845_PM05G05870 [Panicum miliaceum]|uniref:Response regulatory domain-containing protein n=1 Tax=Panicum miliaceum TaxID=4540 RepID=A0A3L6SYK0_PANMI|nr:hypothetical protein C2845_PM05G05870 [Panicum miliaceum]
MRSDFLSHHTPFLSSFVFHHISWNPFMCLYIYQLNHTHTLQKASKASHAKHAYFPAFSLLCNSSPLQLLVASSSFLVRNKEHEQEDTPGSSSALVFPPAMAVATETPFHVLAVDDSLPDRKLIERLLKTSSFQVTTVDSGSKALEFLGIHGDEDSSPPISVHADQLEVAVNLIITDYCMPGMTGYDLLKKIKESTSLRDIPVVIMSSENIPSRINRCLEEGADEFFLKPVRLSDMSRLKPHILKSRCKEHCHQEQHQQSDSDSDSNSDSNECSNPTNNSSSDKSNSRKREGEDNEEVLPQTNRSRHS